jgi:spore coat polysaccharide biosynthesis predicted glycosyltransferase SpsG
MKTRPPARFLFRLAAGPRIGFGHLVRCRALARALSVRPLTSIRGGPAAHRVAGDLGHAVVGGGLRNLATTEMLIVDDPSPRQAERWLLAARRAGVAAATIHDLGVGSLAADLVVDGSVTERGAPEAASAGSARGVRFAILDPSVVAARARRDDGATHRQRRVLIAFGGGSHVFAVAGALVAAIAGRCPGVEVRVAAGFCRRPRPPLHGARWIERVHGLAVDLARSDVAVVAGGVTLYEACAIGVPSVAIAVTTEQRGTIAAFARQGAVVDAGALSDGTRTIREAAAAVADLLDDGTMRRGRAAVARRLVDGRGAARVATRIRSVVAARARGNRRA